MNTKIISIVSALLLLIGILPFPNPYYVVLRILIFLSALLLVKRFYANKVNSLVLLFLIISMLFNPIFFVSLIKGTWVLIDIFAALIFLLASIWENLTIESKHHFTSEGLYMGYLVILLAGSAIYSLFVSLNGIIPGIAPYSPLDPMWGEH